MDCPMSMMVGTGCGQEQAFKPTAGATSEAQRSFDLNTWEFLTRARQAEDACAWV